jgi:hypothetical protein
MCAPAGRCSVDITYDVGFQRDGRLTALRLRGGMLAGHAKDLSGDDIDMLRKGSDMVHAGKRCKTLKVLNPEGYHSDIDMLRNSLDMARVDALRRAVLQLLKGHTRPCHGVLLRCTSRQPVRQ